MKKAFTLIELIVVVGIIMILSASLLVVAGGATESARASKCQANMRNLAQACYTIAMKDPYKRYPHAGSAEYVDVKKTGHRYEKFYGENKGWISWLSNTTQDGDSYYRSNPAPTSHRANEYAGCFSSFSDVNYAYTNGAVWTAVAGNTSCYKCPTMLKKCKEKYGSREMAWSYVMNSAFGYDWSHGGDTTDTPHSGKTAGSMKRADRTLLFAEIDLENLAGGGNGDYTADCVLEYDSGNGGNREKIGFNHKFQKTMCAHVAFADGHVERILQPKSGNLYDLTKWLCEGYDVTFANGEYRQEKDSIDED